MRLSVEDLSFSFGETRVLKNLSFAVAPGEFVGLMGPNGSGKTTLLRCMTSYLQSPENAIFVDGHPLQRLSPATLARTFAVVPQSSSTDFSFTAHDIVMMGRLPHRKNALAGVTRKDADAVEDAMRRTNTLQFASRPFSELSGGERQRVVIARAVAQRPKALLLDEPTVYLDISGQLEVMDLVRDLNREEGMMVIAVLHDVNLAARYCDRIALLSGGRLESIGTPVEVLTPETIQGVYGIDVVVRRDPFTNTVYVVPHSSPLRVHRHGTRVHLLCGGGAGGPIMKTLIDNGFGVSAGVLNVLDSDYENAKDLHIPTVAETPFAPVGDEAHRENMRLIAESEVIVVSPFPVGPGNLRNLEAARAAIGLGKRVLIVSPEPGRAVDFAGGRADALIEGMISSGAQRIRNVEELVSMLSKRGGAA